MSLNLNHNSHALLHILSFIYQTQYKSSTIFTIFASKILKKNQFEKSTIAVENITYVL